MDNLKKTVTIDLAEYGQQGTIEMCKPNFRKQNELKNMLGRCAKNPHTENGQFTADEINYGDMLIANVLSYVRKAPFKQNVEGFLDYSDRMDENELGSADRLFERMQEAMAELQADSPFVSSP